MKTSRRLVESLSLCGLISDHTVYLKSFKPRFHLKLEEVSSCKINKTKCIVPCLRDLWKPFQYFGGLKTSHVIGQKTMNVPDIF